ncbi:MAG: O-antigen ligase family protein [Candidatus Krumholzibacteria bacterium]
MRKRITELLWQYVPIAAVLGLASLVLASQVVRPHRRMIKMSVMLVALVIMLRFEMLYSLYFFVFLFPFPSGILVTSTNILLMTLLTLLWMVRANATGVRLFARTEIDGFVILFLVAYLLSFFNIEQKSDLIEGVKIVWRQATAFAFFYLIVTFVTDEKKLEGIIKVASLSAGFLVLTALIEMVSPGITIIPGWIMTGQKLGQGELGYRLEALRVGGSVASHGLLSDYCTISIFFMVMLFMRARNPIEKLMWLAVSTGTFIVLLATANRGAFFSFIFGVIYFLYVFRHRFNLVRYVIVISAILAFFSVAQLMLDRYTLAASITQRVVGTEFIGWVPDSRVGVWEAPLRRSTEHLFFGHGPFYGVAPGLERMLWPHNAYIYYLYTLGLLGLTAFMLIVYRVARTSFRHRSLVVRNTFVGTVMGILHIQLAMFLLEQLRTDHQRNTDFVYIYIAWMLFGLIVAAGKLIREREKAAAVATSTTDNPAPSTGELSPGWPVTRPGAQAPGPFPGRGPASS